MPSFKAASSACLRACLWIWTALWREKIEGRPSKGRIQFWVTAILGKRRAHSFHGTLDVLLSSGLEQLNQIRRPTDVPDHGLLCDLLWAEAWQANRDRIGQSRKHTKTAPRVMLQVQNKSEGLPVVIAVGNSPKQCGIRANRLER